MTIPSVMGYASQDSVRAGDTISFHVSCTSPTSYRATTVRLHAPEVGPAGPPFDESVVDSAANGDYPSVVQPLSPGSYVVIHSSVALSGSLSFAAFVKPTLPAAGRQVIMHVGSHEGYRWSLQLSDEGTLQTVVEGPAAAVAATSMGRLRARGWYLAFASLNLEADVLSVGSIPLGSEPWEMEQPNLATVQLPAAVARSLGHVDQTSGMSFGARLAHDARVGRDVPELPFNGCIERPRLWARGLAEQELTAMAQAGPACSVADAVGDWDFSRDISSTRIVDIGPNGWHGETGNLPTRAIRGCAWTGETLDWRAAPEQYGAIHFHDDDVGDAQWDESFRLDIDPSWVSGCYAMKLTVDARDEFYIPFFVRPGRSQATADVVFLVPTATYAAYANMWLRTQGQAVELQHGRLTVLDGTDLLLLTQPELGKSTYDTHSDGSLVCYSTLRRPVTNFRPKGRIYKFCEDMLIVDWLEHEQCPFDVVTDEDVHREGAAALNPYRVVVTASHPEYASIRMLDAIDDFLNGGGRLMYLGGNGFYVAAEFHPSIPGTVEVRRPGLEALWPIDHTEANFSFSGAPGGPLAKIGRPAELLVGVGFITQGFDECRPYRRHHASHDPRVAFMFDGIGGETVGDFGLLQGGAAGYEIDRFDISKGSPPHALVLASSEDHSNTYDLMVPSLVDLLPRRDPTAPAPIRADLVFFETAPGGAVFSVGSIAWAGSLSHDHWDNDVARVSANTLRRFRDPSTFSPPLPAS